MIWFACSGCKSVEFQPIVQLNQNSEGKIGELVDNGMVKCSNCATRYHVADDGSIVVLESAPQSVARVPRVRSSVSGEDRGKGSIAPSNKF